MGPRRFFRSSEHSTIDMATAPPQASQFWHQGLKIRKHLMKHIEKLQTESPSGSDASRFSTIEVLLEKFRLSFVHTAFLDFAWAVNEKAEEALWKLHISINTEYRRIQGRLQKSSHVVERRKVEKSYFKFLRVAQKFYEGYIQRLTARYDVPELRRIASGFEAQPIEGIDQISPVLAELRDMVLTSCHLTLVRMGDLSRYRAQARHKNSGYVAALAHYSLAHQLKPKSGYAHHQMGMAHLDQGKHLDVVYHFYRSMVAASSHPNGKSNLEAEFKTLQLSSASRAGRNVSGTQDAFSMWFVRLHAHFYKGEAFSQQAELEDEIMHRLEMACRCEHSTETLLKMTLVNIAAHHVASANYDASQTVTAYQFYLFTLRFNAMFMSALCATFEPQLREAVSVEESSGASSVNVAQVTPIVQALLPILRLYSMWLVAQRREVRAAADVFGGVVPALMRNLANVLTLLCAFTYSQDGLIACPYLLPEDVVIQGFDPLSEDMIPQVCRCFFRWDGTPKTHLEDSGSGLEPAQESSARVLDILRCAYFLAEDQTLPLSYRVAADDRLGFEPSFGTSSTSRAATPVQMASQVTSSEVVSDFQNDGGRNCGGRNSTANLPDTLVEPLEQPIQTIDHEMLDYTDLGSQSAVSDLLQEQQPMDEAESRVFNMVVAFLDPPDRQRSPYPVESSYGMHTGTANEVPGSFQTHESPSSSAPSGVLCGTFTPLPWHWFDIPKPNGKTGSLTPSAQSAFFNAANPVDPSTRGVSATAAGLSDPFAESESIWDEDPRAFIPSIAAPWGQDEASSSASPGAELTNDGDGQLQATSARAVSRSSASPGVELTNDGDGQLQATSARAVPRSSPVTPSTDTLQSDATDAAVPDTPPQSTSTSAFSYSSNLHQGTPAASFG